MIEKISSLAYSNDTSNEPRPLTDLEKMAAERVLSKYFGDAKKDLNKFLEDMIVVPADFYGSIFYKFSALVYLELQFADLPNEKRELDAEYLHNLLGMDEDEAKDYLTAMDKRRAVLAGYLDKKPSVVFKNYDEESLQQARKEALRLEDIWDRELDRCMPYRREASNSCREAEEAYREAEEEVKMIELFLMNNLGQIPAKKAIEEYNKHHNVATDEKTKS